MGRKETKIIATKSRCSRIHFAEPQTGDLQSQPTTEATFTAPSLDQENEQHDNPCTNPPVRVKSTECKGLRSRLVTFIDVRKTLTSRIKNVRKRLIIKKIKMKLKNTLNKTC